MTLRSDERFPETIDGWRLHLTRTVDDARFDRALRPLVVVPGYGMNGFIFGFHPRGTSLVAHFAAEGREVWVANLRGQGASTALEPDAPGPALVRYATVDLPAILDTVLEHTRTTATKVDMIGASLGGSIAYAYLALTEAPRIGALVAMGSPLRWSGVSPMIRIPFGSPRLASLLRVRGTRRMAELGLPFATKMPGLLSLYLNSAHVDLTHAATMIRTVEDPHPRVNSDIAKWLRAGDMRLGGINVTEAMRARREPLFVVLGNRDGIVPAATALSVREVWGGPLETLTVGDARRWYAHADLFVGDRAPERVFTPIADWLRARE